jgi:pyruvyl transferase EpsO
MKSIEIVNYLTTKIDLTLRPLLSNSKQIALLDFPNHWNVGDSAIWLGELKYLQSFDLGRLVYTCDIASYSPTQLSAVIRNGTILLSGGGNFGDLHERHQLFREQVIKDFPQNPIIQLPQSIYFQNSANIRRAKTVIDDHENITLLVRDKTSLLIARNEFKCPAVLCPDMAFLLGPVHRPREPSEKVVWLARTDKESKKEKIECSDSIHTVDWINEISTPLSKVSYVLRRLLVRCPGVWHLLRPALSETDKLMARQRLRRGCNLLARGRFVITDRLHGHILCLLLDIPHVILDNTYGKLASFHEAWTNPCRIAYMSNSYSEALQIINRLTQRGQ